MSLKLSLLTFIFSFSRSIKVWGGGDGEGCGHWIICFLSYQVSLINKCFLTVYQLILLGFLGK